MHEARPAPPSHARAHFLCPKRSPARVAGRGAARLRRVTDRRDADAGGDAARRRPAARFADRLAVAAAQRDGPAQRHADAAPPDGHAGVAEPGAFAYTNVVRPHRARYADARPANGDARTIAASISADGRS